MTASAFLAGVQGQFEANWLQSIGEAIHEVEAELVRQMASEVETVEAVGKHTLEAGGKRLRPAFLLLSARATGLPFDEFRSVQLAACMEMIHMATLIHDDVIDHSATRRGRPTASAQFGATESILSGDVLLSRAMAILARDGDVPIIRKVSGAVVDLAEGEVKELQHRGVFDLREEDYRRVLHLKTATFIQACCEVGAQVAGASESVQIALGEYGYHVGMAFQIADDLLDYQGDPEMTGKPRATDFCEGCATLPLIRYAARLEGGGLASVRAAFGNPDADGVLEEMVAEMAASGIFADCATAARNHIETAKAALAKLDDSPNRQMLESVADFVVSRSA